MNNKWGGKREGAGRKPTNKQKKLQRKFCATDSEYIAIKNRAMQENKSISQFIIDRTTQNN